MLFVYDIFRSSFRQCLKRPLLVAAITLVMALGIGVNTIMFGIIDRTLLSPPMHIEDAERVRVLKQSALSQESEYLTEGFSFEDYLRLRDCSAFESVEAIFNRSHLLSPTIGQEQDSFEAAARAVTGGFFDTLGAKPRLGRFFAAEDDAPGAEKVVVLGHGIWVERYASSVEIIGRRIAIGSFEATVIGVAPAGFTGVDLGKVDLWLPLRPGGEILGYGSWFEDVGNVWLRLIVRLKSGSTAPAANQEATAILRQLNREQRPNRFEQARISAESLVANATMSRQAESDISRWLGGVSLCVLLIACANVANLLLVQSIRRRSEMALRLSLGLSRGKLILQHLAESVLLAAFGGLAALAVAFWAGGLIAEVVMPDVDWTHIGSLSRLAAFSLLVSLAAGALAGIVPSWQASRANLASTLRPGGVAMRTSRAGIRTGLLFAQTTMSVLLLVGAGLFVRSLWQVNALDLGIEERGVWVASAKLEPGVERAEAIKAYDNALSSLRGTPGVVAAAGAYTRPFGSSMVRGLKVSGQKEVPSSSAGGPYLYVVGDGFFETLEVDILRGRALGSEDGIGAQPVAVVNSTMAERLWPEEGALGQCIFLGRSESCRVIVGVAENVRRRSLFEDPAMQYYIPLSQVSVGPRDLLVKIAPGGPGPDLVRGQLQAADARFRQVKVQALSDRIEPLKRSWRMGASLFSTFGLLALAVAAVGLFSALAFEVAQRQGEIGIRAALGASTPSLVRLFLGRTARIAILGVVIGNVVALLAAPRLEHLLFRTSPYDPAVYAGVILAILSTALLAGLLPSWRASRVDPNRTLRAE